MVAVRVIFNQVMRERGIEKAIDVKILRDQLVVPFIVLPAVDV